MAEFPTTREAAALSRESGLQVLMGALDIFSSDYVPFSLLQAVFLLSEQELTDLPAAVRLVPPIRPTQRACTTAAATTSAAAPTSSASEPPPANRLW
ncbi:hypothetical protein ACLE20_15040 [Rhizobium sp. YIM 134829]|uniref:hypothetical protein n=1 Tax=Rhizobium sp. YIM 134829 TaxID=3390453 RepID=UPI00397E0970